MAVSSLEQMVDHDGSILLEPTIEGQLPVASGDEPSIRMAMLQGSAPTLGTETSTFLGDRLRVVAWALAAAYAVVVSWNAFTRESFVWIIPTTIGLRCALCFAVGLLLTVRKTWSLGALRAIEGILFALLILLMLVSQYYGNLQYIRRGQFESVVAYERTGVINAFMLMMIYGALIPNDPKRTARVVSLMVLGPLFVLAVMLEQPIASAADEGYRINPLILAGSNAIYLCVGAFVAIYSAYILNGLRNDLHEARRLGQYQLGERIGSGGMGDVFLAEHRLLKRPCALKLIKPDIATNTVALARFEREVQAAATLNHPSTIEIFDYGHADDGTFYYVMEYLPGMSSHDLVARYGPMPPGRAIYLMRQVCGALTEAHLMGIIHRDLKPANILVAILGGACDVAKVLDFGLAKLTTPGAAALTGEMTVSGTPAYMSPEQAAADASVDGRTDIYAMGAILYFWLTGRPPFEGTNPMEVMIANARDPVVPPSTLRPEIPGDLEAIVLKCLAKRPDERFPEARALSDALGDCPCAFEWDARRAQQWWAEKAAEEVAESGSGLVASRAPESARSSS